MVLQYKWTGLAAVLFYTGILGTLVCTDVLKVVLANGLGRYLQLRHVVRLRQAVGVGLILFGLVFFVRTALEGDFLRIFFLNLLGLAF